jgi:hypothetical protein
LPSSLTLPPHPFPPLHTPFRGIPLPHALQDKDKSKDKNKSNSKEGENEDEDEEQGPNKRPGPACRVDVAITLSSTQADVGKRLLKQLRKGRLCRLCPSLCKRNQLLCGGECADVLVTAWPALRVGRKQRGGGKRGWPAGGEGVCCEARTWVSKADEQVGDMPVEASVWQPAAHSYQCCVAGCNTWMPTSQTPYFPTPHLPPAPYAAHAIVHVCSVGVPFLQWRLSYGMHCGISCPVVSWCPMCHLSSSLYMRFSGPQALHGVLLSPLHISCGHPTPADNHHCRPGCCCCCCCVVVLAGLALGSRLPTLKCRFTPSAPQPPPEDPCRPADVTWSFGDTGNLKAATSSRPELSSINPNTAETNLNAATPVTGGGAIKVRLTGGAAGVGIHSAPVCPEHTLSGQGGAGGYNSPRA